MSVVVTNIDIDVELSGEVVDWGDGGSLDGGGEGGGGEGGGGGDPGTLSYGGADYPTATIGGRVWDRTTQNMSQNGDCFTASRRLWVARPPHPVLWCGGFVRRAGMSPRAPRSNR